MLKALVLITVLFSLVYLANALPLAVGFLIALAVAAVCCWAIDGNAPEKVKDEAN